MNDVEPGHDACHRVASLDETGAESAASRAGMVAFALIAAVALGATAYLLWPVVMPANGAPPGALTVDLSMTGFTPGRIEARAGEPVTLYLVNRDGRLHDGGGWHQFAIDDLEIDVRVPPREAMVFTFEAPATGRFDFYCDICCGGSVNPNMVGELVVAP